MQSPKRPQKCEPGTLQSTSFRGETEVKRARKEARQGVERRRKAGAVNIPKGAPGGARWIIRDLFLAFSVTKCQELGDWVVRKLRKEISKNAVK